MLLNMEWYRIFLYTAKMGNLTKAAQELYITQLRKRGRLSTVEDDKMKKILKAMSIYVIGLGTMINTETLDLDISEATLMIGEMYEAMLMKEGITSS